jgi:hypothetical protein
MDLGSRVSIDAHVDVSVPLPVVQYFMQQLQSGIYTANITNWKRCSNATEPNQACSSEWANGSVRLACSTAYTDQNGNQIQNGFDLEDPYYVSRQTTRSSRFESRTIAHADVVASLVCCFRTSPSRSWRCSSRRVVSASLTS